MIPLRIAISVVLVATYVAISSFMSPFATLALSHAAGAQFDASDASYVGTMFTFSFWHYVASPGFIVLLCALALIWAGPARKFFVVTTAIVLAGPFLAPKPALAYWDNKDIAEVAIIMPNESAFWVPDEGNNKDSQRAFESEAYLNANKIASKRFQIPHAKVSGSVAWGWDNYAPTGKLYIVDRTPYSREWVEGKRGSSQRDEGFKCQSSEGLDITVGVTISTYVTEQDAAKFLFHYGITPPRGDREDPRVIFTSVLYGRSLQDVMDSNIRNAVQTLVCNEIMAHDLVYDNSHAVAIMADIKKSITTFLAEKGISLDFIGWADTFTFSEKVQDAVDRAFVAQQDAIIAAKLGPLTGTIQQLAVAEALRNRWDGKTPNNVSLTFVPSGVTNFLEQLLKPFVSTTGAPASKAP